MITNTTIGASIWLIRLDRDGWSTVHGEIRKVEDGVAIKWLHWSSGLDRRGYDWRELDDLSLFSDQGEAVHEMNRRNRELHERAGAIESMLKPFLHERLDRVSDCEIRYFADRLARGGAAIKETSTP